MVRLGYVTFLFFLKAYLIVFGVARIMCIYRRLKFRFLVVRLGWVKVRLG